MVCIFDGMPAVHRENSSHFHQIPLRAPSSLVFEMCTVCVLDLDRLQQVSTTENAALWGWLATRMQRKSRKCAHNRWEYCNSCRVENTKNLNSGGHDFIHTLTDWILITKQPRRHRSRGSSLLKISDFSQRFGLNRLNSNGTCAHQNVSFEGFFCSLSKLNFPFLF